MKTDLVEFGSKQAYMSHVAGRKSGMTHLKILVNASWAVRKSMILVS